VEFTNKNSSEKESRKKYWNEDYYRYWRVRVKEANENTSDSSSVVKGDSLTAADKSYFSAINLLNIKEDSSVLEIGCGFGRSIPFLYSKTKNVSAIDISEAMIRAARKECREYKEVKFTVSEAEKTLYQSNIFDNLICYFVFDALCQKEALLEMNRILKKTGTVLITGKNDNYFVDDREALIAEGNARQKGHPNCFTDLKKLLEHLEEFGFALIDNRFYLRRGDTNKECFETSMPDFFYEYTIVLKKIKHISHNIDIEISSRFSKTFRLVTKGQE
jgi:ubiquinone/menaquinone biosynthesis C-methylase UbiE